MKIIISDTRDIPQLNIIELYQANKWSAGEKPNELYKALMNSHTLISAWERDRLVGIVNAISGGYLVVYYPHLLVHPTCQGKGIGQRTMEKMQDRYKDFHMQMLTAYGKAISFYNKMGFEMAGETQPMWIYGSKEH